MKSILMLAGILLFSTTSLKAEIRLEGIGEIGGGLFFPTGSDENVARKGPAVQLVAGVRFAPHIGLEAEFLYVPLLLKDFPINIPGAGPGVTYPHRKSSQIVAMAGIRFVTGSLLSEERSFVGYVSSRIGFARISLQTDSLHPNGDWIGGAVNEFELPGSGNPNSIRVRRKGIALSPKAGTLIRVGSNSAVDLSLQPLFIFDRGKVTTQIYLTLSLALSSWQDF